MIGKCLFYHWHCWASLYFLVCRIVWLSKVSDYCSLGNISLLKFVFYFVSLCPKLKCT